MVYNIAAVMGEEFTNTGMGCAGIVGYEICCGPVAPGIGRNQYCSLDDFESPWREI